MIQSEIKIWFRSLLKCSDIIRIIWDYFLKNAQIILPLKLKWNVEDLDDGTTDYNLKLLLPGRFVSEII